MDTITLQINPRDRMVLATTIERLINMLDEMTPDPDLEDGTDAEPSLGWTDRVPSALAKDWHHDDREDQCDDEGAEDSDREPNGDELDYSDADCDTGAFIWGGGEDAPNGRAT